MPNGNGSGNFQTVFASTINAIHPQHRTVTTFFRGSPEELLRELRYQKKTGTLEISFSQGGTGIIKWTEREKIS